MNKLFGTVAVVAVAVVVAVGVSGYLIHENHKQTAAKVAACGVVAEQVELYAKNRDWGLREDKQVTIAVESWNRMGVRGYDSDIKTVVNYVYTDRSRSPDELKEWAFELCTNGIES